jgi:hypothetical protein
MRHRSSFSGNRDRVQDFRAAWSVPEVVWDERTSAPAEPGRADRWIRDHRPYYWLLLGESTVIGLTSVVAEWQFSAGHEFEALDLRIESACDPDYLAEKLSLAAEAAAFAGWEPDDLPSLQDWIGDLTSTRPVNMMVSGYKRLGFLLFDLRRFPLPSGVATTMKITLTDKALDGTPLNSSGGRR